jgi:hypothetical protein
LNEIYQIWAAPNIVAAKMMATNLSRQVLLSDILDYMGEIIAFWGYEFYPEEWRFPFTLGGWLNPTYLGVRLDD